MPDTHLPSVPNLKTPVDDAPIDGSAAIFAWEAVPGAMEYRVQVDTDPDFEAPVCSVETGETTVLTLYEMLPENGSIYHWRVQAMTAAGWQSWSQAASFKASTAQQARAYQEQQLPTITVGGSATQSTDPETNAPYRISYTSRTASAVFFTIMLVSFVALLILLQARSLARIDSSTEMVARASIGSTLPTSYQVIDSTSRTYQIPIDSAMHAVVRDANRPAPPSSGWRLPN